MTRINLEMDAGEALFALAAIQSAGAKAHHTRRMLLATGPIETERHQLVHKMAPSADRSHKRSVFFPGIAAAMADQWGAAA